MASPAEGPWEAFRVTHVARYRSYSYSEAYAKLCKLDNHATVSDWHVLRSLFNIHFTKAMSVDISAVPVPPCLTNRFWLITRHSYRDGRVDKRDLDRFADRLSQAGSPVPDDARSQLVEAQKQTQKLRSQVCALGFYRSSP